MTEPIDISTSQLPWYFKGKLTVNNKLMTHKIWYISLSIGLRTGVQLKIKENAFKNTFMILKKVYLNIFKKKKKWFVKSKLESLINF